MIHIPSKIVLAASMSSEQSIISSLECQLAQKERELAGLREAMKKLPEFSNLDGDVCFKVPDPEAEDRVGFHHPQVQRVHVVHADQGHRHTDDPGKQRVPV